MDRKELFKIAKEYGFKPRFVSPEIREYYLIPFSEKVLKDDPRYYMLLCEIFYWLSTEKFPGNPIPFKEDQIKTVLETLKSNDPTYALLNKHFTGDE